MGNLFKDGHQVAKKTLEEQWNKEKRSLKSSKSKKQPLGDKDDPVDGIVRVAASLVGTVSEAYQYRKDKKHDSRVEHSENASLSHQNREDMAPINSQNPLNPKCVPSPRSQDRCQETSSNAESSVTLMPTDFNEAAWQCDEARRDPEELSTELEGEATGGNDTSQGPSQDEKHKVGDLAQAFIERHPFNPATVSTCSSITLPVVIPQRRPKNRGRGFVRAYSPVLADAGINQLEFLDFVDSFNRAIQPSEWLSAIELISWAGFAAPEPISLLIDQAAEAATEAAIEAQSRYRSGRFLDRVNADYFLPRGLVAVVVTWKSWDDEENGTPPPDPSNVPVVTTSQKSQEEDVSSQKGASSRKLAQGVSYEGLKVTGRSDFQSDLSFSREWRELRSRQTTPRELHTRLTLQFQERMKRYNGIFHCLETAPLVFPTAASDHEAMVTKKNGKRMNAFDRGGQWLNSFHDRRSQTKWAAKTQDGTRLTTRQHEFRSRYADPSHPAASGDIVAFATGGKWSTRGKVKTGRQVAREGELVGEEEGECSSGDEKKYKDWEEKKQKMDRKRREKAKKRAEKAKEGGSMASSLLKTDVLYLVIMNVPVPAADKATDAQVLVQQQQMGEPSAIYEDEPVGKASMEARRGNH
ncbi:FAD binding domain protein [Sarocladium implicatum]|nr:FAD binding domain protein [Sarocladium implicatum]